MSYSIGDGIASVALVGGVVAYLQMTHRTRRQRMDIIHQERMAAMEKGIPLPEFPLERAPQPPDPRVLPIMGVVFFSLSVGAMIVLYMSAPFRSQNLWIAPLPLAFLGIGLFAYNFLNGER